MNNLTANQNQSTIGTPGTIGTPTTPSRNLGNTDRNLGGTDLGSKLRQPIDSALNTLDQERQVVQRELSNALDWAKQNKLPLILGGCGVVLVAAGVTGGLLYYQAQQRRGFLGFFRNLF